jgi:hypothetical protein
MTTEIISKFDKTSSYDQYRLHKDHQRANHFPKPVSLT